MIGKQTPFAFPLIFFINRKSKSPKKMCFPQSSNMTMQLEIILLVYTSEQRFLE